jgi:hypothetical protein
LVPKQTRERKTARTTLLWHKWRRRRKRKRRRSEKLEE